MEEEQYISVGVWCILTRSAELEIDFKQPDAKQAFIENISN